MKTKINYNNKKFEDALGYTAEHLLKLFDYFSSVRLPYERMWKLLEAYDSGEFWKYVAQVLPNYSIRPDTNWVNWGKENYVNSLYVGTYRGDVFCREADNEQTTLAINEFLEFIFNKLKFQNIQHTIGERAALLNFGAVEFGWRADVIDGVKDYLFTGEVEAKPIDNLSLFLDPSQKDYQKGRAIFIAEEVPLVELRSEPRFKERMDYFYKNIAKTEDYINTAMGPREYGKGYYGQHEHHPEDGTARLLTCYYKKYDKEIGTYRLDKVWIMDDGFILGIQTNLKPKEFPVKVLYSSKPTKDPYGTPKTKLILNNAITLNLLDAIDSTMVFKHLERGKVVSRKSGLNYELFAKEGDSPKKLWVVDGDPGQVVRFVDLPDLPQDRQLLKSRLELGIMRVLGIDDVYTGTDTNSVQTTGAMDILSQRVTIRDNGRVSLLQTFILECTEYLLKLYLEQSTKVSFSERDQYGDNKGVKEINFEQMRKDNLHFDFTCDVTPNLPNNIQRRAETMNIMMEKQMQYNFNPPLITAEDWVASQDFPNKYKILKRIRDQRMADDVEDIEAELINYAGMTEQGMRPDIAVKQLASERQFKRDNPGLGNVGNASSFQNKQAR